ncbi:hypothetical protein [Mahella sp.]|uniref:hypothetical protein n=1 Tax=Mahella sp. TaxID=2798721 RepID=UPI0025C6C401|nr:hypothetical protein [Mahella sp.]MBZ4666783.1 hypothetical protein [Mahella sp.]
MSRKLYLTVAVLVMAVLLMPMYTSTVYAAPLDKARTYSIVPTEGTPSEYPDYGVGYYYGSGALQQANSYSAGTSGAGYLLVCRSTIMQQPGAYVLKAVGESIANKVVDKVSYNLYFQMWDGYKWVTIGSESYAEYNSDTAISMHYKSVSPRKYYRVTTYHYVLDNGQADINSTTTGYIYVE